VKKRFRRLLATSDRVTIERLRRPRGWLNTSRRKAWGAAVLITLEIAVVTARSMFALRRSVNPAISLVIGVVAVAFIWGLALRLVGTMKALSRVLLALLGVGLLGLAAFLVVLYVS